MKFIYLTLCIFCWLLAVPGWAQTPAMSAIRGQFLTDSIEIGRPFYYALTYRHSPETDVLFPDTATAFRPYQVQKVAVYATQTSESGAQAVSRDSAVYTLVSFETSPSQVLRVPIRVLNAADCTIQWTQIDTVFLHSKLLVSRLDSANRPLKLITETQLAPLQQQFNYAMLAIGIFSMAFVSLLLYGLFGRFIQRQWRLYQLNRRHNRFLTNYNQLSQRLNSVTAPETTNQAVVMWKLYLERIDRQPYMSLTTPELAERINDTRVTDALREADRMIYGGAFSQQSQESLNVLRDVATQAYQRARTRLQRPVGQDSASLPSESAATPSTL